MIKKDMKLCHCGSCEDALKTAEKLFVEMVAHNCPSWALQVSTMLRSMCVDTVKSQYELLSNQDVSILCNALVEYRRSYGDKPEILINRSTDERRKFLAEEVHS